MQSYALTVDKFLDHAAKWCSGREIVTAEAGKIKRRATYQALRERSNRLSGALIALGLKFGDRIGTLAWNTQHHLEMYYAAMGAGFVCHTLNPRLTAAHLGAMIDEAENRVLAVAADLAPIALDLAAQCRCLEHVIVLDDTLAGGSYEALTPHAQVWSQEALIAGQDAPSAWGAFDENTPAGLCYTSGTTGKPKGVLYTHRSNYLHTLRALQADAFALTGSDVLLVAVPMFHANGWGLPFAAPAAGAKLVLPGRHLDGASLANLMREERVSIAAGVQTIWLSLLDHLDQVGEELPHLKRITIGGSKCPQTLIERMERRLGVRVQTSWGMTELSPLGTAAPPDAPSDKRASGRATMGLDLKLTDANGATLPCQRGVEGHLKVKGASVIDRYYNAPVDALDAEGYFDTGDLASIDEDGNVTISGRSKDLIKSGGEWINPAEIEEIVGAHASVGQVAVIARDDAKWGERPVLIVEPLQGNNVDTQALLRLLRGKIADWWIPDQVVEIRAMPLAATGKIDKNQLRTDYASGRIVPKGVNR